MNHSDADYLRGFLTGDREAGATDEDALDPERDLVPVLQTTDPALLPIAKSVLEAAGIPYLVHGEAGVNVFPLGPAAARVTGRRTGAIILVRGEHLEEARALLETPAEETEGENG